MHPTIRAQAMTWFVMLWGKKALTGTAPPRVLKGKSVAAGRATKRSAATHQAPPRSPRAGVGSPAISPKNLVPKRRLPTGKRRSTMPVRARRFPISFQSQTWLSGGKGRAPWRVVWNQWMACPMARREKWFAGCVVGGW